MALSDADLESFVLLLDRAEIALPYVTLPRLRRLAIADQSFARLRRQLPGLIRLASERGVLLSDSRLRLTRSGAAVPLTIYRLNRRSPFVKQLLQMEFGKS